MAAAWHLNRHAVQIFVIVMLNKFSGFQADSRGSPSQEAGRKLGKVVYDVSQIIRREGNPNGAEILPEDLYAREVNTSANYFLANNAVDDTICWEVWLCRRMGIKGVALIFNDKANMNDLIEVADFFTTTNTTILNLLKWDKSSIDSATIVLDDFSDCRNFHSIMKDFVQDIKLSFDKQSVRLGVEYNDDLLERCADFPLSEYVDHTILRIRAFPLTTMLSYGFFYETVNRLIAKNRAFVEELDPQNTLYIRLDIGDWNATISAKKYDKYNTLMKSYLETFSKQNSGNEVFIFNPTLKQESIMPSKVFFKQCVSLYHYNFETKETDKHLLACAHQRMVRLLLLNIQNIIVSVDVLSSLLDTCHTSTENAQTHFNPPPNTSLSLFLFNNDQVEKFFQLRRDDSAARKVRRVYIYPRQFNKTENLMKAVKSLQFQNIDVGCISVNFYHNDADPNISIAVNNTIWKCGGELMKVSKEIVQHVTAPIKKPEHLLSFLSSLEQEKQQFERFYPGKNLTWAIRLGDLLRKESLYCNPTAKRIKEYYQTVFSFAIIHGWSGVAFRFTSVTPGPYDGMWLNRRIDTFPVLSRTNVPVTADKELAMTYPCIRKIEDASRSSINFLENQYSGATFPASLREKEPLSPTELQTLLELAGTRFPSVEIIVASQTDIKLVEKVVGVNDPSYSSLLHSVAKPFAYIEVQLQEAYRLQKQIRTILSNKHAAVHFSNWESLSDEEFSILWRNFQSSSTSKFGVAVQNCGEEMESKIAALKSLPFMPQVSYILCNTPTVTFTPDNKDSDWMDQYLGTLFYIKSYMEHFLSLPKEAGQGVEVMFRLNYICHKRKKVEKFLRFLNEINQHSAAYKIRYFLVRAFEKETSADCVNSWWRPDSYSGLSNISSYVNNEDEYAGRQARYFPAPAPPSASIPEPYSDAIYFIIFVPTFALFILALIAQWLYHRKQKTTILTQMEVRQFYNGSEQSSPSSGNEYVLDFENMKFPKHYEIPRRDIKTEEIIGSGQFGVVHRGILSKLIEVAIKIPRPGCGKEQFKSTLSELKILSHIGEHLNIVSFLGAYTKGIANGNLQIVIEFCKNGCLLQHLRQNQGNVEDDESISLFQMNGFALQIASGMEYIAEKRVVHGDLAARNVLLTAEWTCKIADFGLSRRLYEMNEYVKTSQEPLPWRWMAPESLRNMEFTTKSDVWSYGVTLWEIFSSGMVPYPGLNWTANYVGELENGMRMGKAPHATDDIHAKILECWNLNAEARPTFTELKEYFVGLRNEQYLNLSKV